MKVAWLGLILIIMAACSGPAASPEPVLPSAESEIEMPSDDPSPAHQAKTAALPDLGPAPELENDIWLNTDHPLLLSDQRGKVVLLEMWTFG